MTEPFVPPMGCNPRVVCKASNVQVPAEETAQQRLMRLYAADGGPLLGWLLDECNLRGQTQKEMAEQLGVTLSYIYQLRSGTRRTAHISQEMARACARYLGVPPIVVKVLAGSLPMSDFVWPAQTEEAAIDRALQGMRTDPIARTLMPTNAKSLPLEAKRALVLMYSESSRQDVLGVRYLPQVLQSLQRAAVIHDDHSERALLAS